MKISNQTSVWLGRFGAGTATVAAFLAVAAVPASAQNFIVGANVSSGQVNAYDAVSGAFVATITSGGTAPTPHDVIVGPDGNLYIVALGAGQIIKFTPTTAGSLSGSTSVFATGLVSPTYATFDSSGNLFVSTNAGVRSYNLSGTLLATYASPGSAARGVFASGGSLYAAYEGSNLIRRYSIATPTSFTDLATTSAPQDVAVSGSTLFVTSFASSNLTRYTDTGAALTVQQVYSSSINNARGVLLDGNGNVLVGAGASILRGSAGGSTLSTFTTSNTNNVGGLTLYPPAVVSAPEPGALAFLAPLLMVGAVARRRRPRNS